MEPTRAAEATRRAPTTRNGAATQKKSSKPVESTGVDDLLTAGMELLRSMPGTAENECRKCGRPAGLFEECDRCFLDRLENQFSELMGEDAKPARESQAPPAAAVAAEPEPEPEPESKPEPEPRTESIPPPVPVATVPSSASASTGPRPAASRRPYRRRRLLALAAVGIVAVGAAFLIANGLNDDPSTSEAQPELGLTGLGDDPAAAIIGTWEGRVEIQYQSGFKDHMDQTITIRGLETGAEVGFSRSQQNGGSCKGPLTFLGTQGSAYRFRYTELNTDQCIATGRITMTPRSDGRIAYTEVTRSSVNRGVLSAQ
jgi:hypothetical protein